jgi:demethylmenaquinone methyltransferase / 2-methoxy-6-polyprenyl-1,4-benzoquinol methylase
MSSEVQEMFENIASRYDATNDVLSFGIHRLWRREAARLSGLTSGASVLDLCCGTGDFANAFSKLVSPSGVVIGVDFVNPMLRLAKQKYGDMIFMQADVLTLPFADKSFDGASIAFGIRNVDNIRQALCEIRRVLKHDGALVVLEFGTPTLPVFREFYRLYARHVMPLVGGLITKNRAAYEYLPRTAEQFPSGQEFLDILDQCRFKNLQLKKLLSGIAYIYTANNLSSEVKVGKSAANC